MRRTIAILLLASATVLSAAACSSSNDTSTTGTTSTTSKGGGNGNTPTTKAALDPTGPKCDAVNKFLIAALQAVKPENQGKEKGAATVTSLEASAKAVKSAFPAKEAPDSRLRNDVDAMLKYLKPLATTPTPAPPDADKTSFDKAKEDMNTFKGMNCKKEGDDSSGDKASTTTTAKKA